MTDLLQYTLYSKTFWFSTFISVIYIYLKFVTFNYFSRKNIPHEKPILLLGNTLQFINGQKSLGETIQESYEKFKHFPIHGIYTFFEPTIIVNDFKLIGSVLIKDFVHFVDRFPDVDLGFDPMLDHIFCERGKKWKNNRAKLSPAFTSRKLKEMFHLLDEIGENLKKLCESPAENSEIVELKELSTRFTTDTIATLAYGCDCNSIQNPNVKFRIYGKEIFDGHPVKVLLFFFAPIILNIFRIRFIKKKVGDYFTRVFEEVVTYRRENNVSKKDFVSLLMELMDHGFIEENDAVPKSADTVATGANIRKMTLREASCQSFVFFAAGFETSSSTITYCLYEMALNPDIQEKVRSEMKNVLCDQSLTYDSIAEMVYLDKVLSETLRMYPTVPLLSRSCVRNYKVPGTNFCISKGMKIIIPVLGIHFDPDIYPEPEKFDPERFDSENVTKRHPMSYIPFGEGPRMCIGKRLGIIQTKIVLIKLLMNYKFSICQKTEIPIKNSTRTFVLTPAKGVYLRIEKAQ